MTEEKSPSPSPTATPAGNQNLIIGLVLGAVVLLLLLLVLQMTSGGLGGGGSSELDQLKAERDSLLAKRAPIPASGSGVTAQNPQALATRLSSDSNTLAGLVTKMQTLLVQREDELKSTRSLYQHASRELEQSRQQLATANVNAAEIERLKRDLADSQSLLTQAESLAAQLRQQLAGAPDANVMARLRTDLDEALLQRDTHQRQVTELQNQMKTMVASGQLDSISEELAALKAKANRLETDNNKLRYEIQKLRAELDRTRLFVDKADDLPAAAKALYVELSKLESATPAELKNEYERISREFRASPIDRIKFQTGSSRIDLDKAEEIRRAVQSSGDDSFFLVVGYASKSGDLASNRKLSADRATTIASVANFQKKSGQGVQAVFLSETARFSPTDLASNQVCEIWEIRR